MEEAALMNSHASQSLLPPHPDSKAVRVLIKGRVQGVFYRDWTVENARELGLKGWVRNRRDGSVEALFSGEPATVDEMGQRCRRGPPSALVTALEVFPCDDHPRTVGFERKPTMMKILYKTFTLQRSNPCIPSSSGACEDHNDQEQSWEELPADVEEGHFVVYAVNDGEPKRFIIRLDYLAHPGFLKLLELAAEEFGLRQAGVLAVPCRSVELRRILGNCRKGDGDATGSPCKN